MKIVRKLMLSIIAFVSVLTCFSISTYAWFQVNSKAKVDGFVFNATGGLGFLISIDGKNYSNDITSEQMKMAMLVGYDSERYQIDNNKLLDKSEGKILSTLEINELVSKSLLLSPVTSKNGEDFTNLAGTSIPKSSGKYVEFSLYFRATSQNADDNLEYDIYLCGEDLDQFVNPELDKKIPKTNIKSEKDTVGLLTDMTIYDPVDGVKVLGPDKDLKTIDVYSSNATRLSIKEESNKEAIIYEITNEFDLGSYATTYDSNVDTTNDDETKKELDRLYNSSYNAMYSYYNNLRPYSKLEPINYEDGLPKTVRDLTDEHIFTSVKSGGPAKKVTFRFWLEGWDADCFDGLSKSINVRLLFNSKPNKKSK